MTDEKSPARISHRHFDIKSLSMEGIWNIKLKMNF
jgi:hypothetical protein